MGERFFFYQELWSVPLQTLQVHGCRLWRATTLPINYVHDVTRQRRPIGQHRNFQRREQGTLWPPVRTRFLGVLWGRMYFLFSIGAKLQWGRDRTQGRHPTRPTGCRGGDYSLYTQRPTQLYFFSVVQWGCHSTSIWLQRPTSRPRRTWQFTTWRTLYSWPL